MKREILYRGKCVETGKWFYNSLLVINKDYYIADCGLNGWVNGVYSFNVRWIRVFPETLGQYTGLKDRNGVMVFENDILQDDLGTIGVVVFRQGRFMSDFYGRTHYYELHLDAETSEVIGNLTDNPDLLKETA